MIRTQKEWVVVEQRSLSQSASRIHGSRICLFSLSVSILRATWLTEDWWELKNYLSAYRW